MTTLPKIAPPGTPTQHVQRSYTTMYTAYPPRELSNSMDCIRIPGRINPLRPPPPKKRINMSWETTDQHFENDKRRMLMQKREHYRYHSAWSKAFYGGPAEQESYRKHFRDVLKQQMHDSDIHKRQILKDKVRESEAAVEYDKQCLVQDSNKFWKKFQYLREYTVDNKKLMENKWQTTGTTKTLEDKYDLEVLRYNPINWSHTLK